MKARLLCGLLWIAAQLHAIVAAASAGAGAAAAPDPQQLLERVRAAYAALGSYTDTGTIVLEERPIGATMIREEHAFTTRYMAPRRFFFEFRKGPAAAERFVIWCPGETFNSWWSATQVAEEYPRGQGAESFAVGTLPTSGSVLLIPPLLFQNAGLKGPLLEMSAPELRGIEKIAGRPMYVLTGPVQANHWTDTVRKTTLWIDVETLLVRRVFEDTPSGQGGSVQRATTTFEPRANPQLDAGLFRFTPPR